MFPEGVETESLVLRQVSEATVDALDLYDRFAAGSESAREVFEYVPQEPYGSVGEAHDDVQTAETQFEAGDVAEYAVFATEGADPREGAGLAGRTALAVEWDVQVGHLGVILARPYWGRGYASECARRLARVAFDDLDLELVEIGHEEGNERSRSVVETFVEAHGGRYEGAVRNRVPVGDEVLDHHRYTITQDEYRAATDSS